MPSRTDSRPAYRGAAPLPAHPALSAPETASAPAPGRAQPVLGLAGLTFVIPLSFLIAFGAGGAEASLRVLGPLTTFALPAVAMIAFWWEDWPGSALRAGWSGLTDTLIVVVAGACLTVIGQAVVSGLDPGVLLDAQPGAGHVPTFPSTMPLAVGVFTAILQLTLVTEGWPLRGLGRFRSGLAAVVLCYVAGTAGYLLLVDVDDAAAAGTSLQDPGGPFTAGVYGAWLTALGVWQIVFFVALRGRPFTAIRRRGPRLAAGNVAVILLGWATYAVLRHPLGWETDRITAVCGSVITAVLIVGMLFEAWPATRLRPLPGRTCALVLMGAVAALLYWALSAYARGVGWRHATPDEWVTFAALNGIGAGIILHVAIWRRWPVITGPAGHADGTRPPAEGRPEEREPT
ncbi:hypothetical protein [Planotetraspora kaengkrachanensis]|uniref:Uncharacterized protein n=1 Tax=Planotetraspora kaengkrachanensis TaxID=575193 RepID=A0A8J3M1L6_9ACTN|nr:hypothetical protein [Planotetraspora kaengkrachanensis]GIG77361.1 hypothetical protein Pka01_04880 [Planotetraspora kaengkrachanensis]